MQMSLFPIQGYSIAAMWIGLLFVWGKRVSEGSPIQYSGALSCKCAHPLPRCKLLTAEVNVWRGEKSNACFATERKEASFTSMITMLYFTLEQPIKLINSIIFYFFH